MNKSRKSPQQVRGKFFNLQEAKIQASILLKSLGSSDSEIAFPAAKRFQRLPEFANFSIAEIPIKDIKHKHALTVIAIENSFKSWADLKSQIDFIVGGFLNIWFANYQEAKVHQQSSGGFLFPYKNQFFICESGYIERLGFDPNDPDWKLIGWDWANPSDKTAWQRLYKKWMRIQGGNNE